jgi:predicted dehydrogenase
MRVLIIGLGSIAKKHIYALKKINPDIELYSLRNSINSEVYDDIINIYSLNEVQQLEFDFSIISNPTFLHAKTIESLIPLKIPLFIEKPLFDSINQRSLLNRINAADIITYVACNLRFLECLQFAKQVLLDKRVNEANVYCGSYLPDWRPGQDFRKTYSANIEMGGGVHIDLIHELDYVMWLFTLPIETFRFTSNNSSLSISAVDYANYLLKYDTFNVNVVLNYYRKDPKRTMEVVCEDGTLTVNILENEVSWNGSIIFQSAKGIQDTYFDQIHYFIENILTRKSSFNDINEAYETLKICIAND